jgi:hypothetical protein
VPNWDDQGTQYAAFIEAQLAAEYDRRASVNTLIALLVAALLAVLAGIPWTSSVPPLKLLHGFLDDPDPSHGRPWGWSNDEVDAREWTAKCNLRTLASLRGGTSLKFVLLILAGLAQVVAVCFLVACTLGVVDTKPAQRPTPAPPPCCPISSSPPGTTSTAETPPVTTNGRR